MRKRRWLDFLLGTLFGSWGDLPGWMTTCENLFSDSLQWTYDLCLINTCGMTSHDIISHHMSYHIIHDLFFSRTCGIFHWQKKATTFKPPGGCRSGSRTTLGHLFSGRLGWGIPSLDFEVWKLTKNWVQLGKCWKIVRKSSFFLVFVCCLLFLFFLFLLLLSLSLVVFLCFQTNMGRVAEGWWRLMKVERRKNSMSGDGFLNSKANKCQRISPPSRTFAPRELTTFCTNIITFATCHGVLNILLSQRISPESSMWMRFYCKRLARCLTCLSVRKNREAKFLNAEELGQPGPGPQWRHGAAEGMNWKYLSWPVLCIPSCELHHQFLMEAIALCWYIYVYNIHTII